MKMGTTRSECRISSNQLYGLLTHKRRQATEISGWEAVKDFFKQLFSFLPGVDFQSEAERLDTLFNQVWHHKAPRDDLTCTLKGIRNFLHLIDKLEAEHFSFAVSRSLDDDKIVLNIRYHNAAQPQQDCSTHIAFSADDDVHIIDFMQTHMTYSDTTTAYKLDRDKLNSAEKNIIFATEVTEQYVFLVSLRRYMNDAVSLRRYMNDALTRANGGIKQQGVILSKLEKEQNKLNEIKKALNRPPSEEKIGELIIKAQEELNSAVGKYSSNWPKEDRIKLDNQEMIKATQEFQKMLADILAFSPAQKATFTCPMVAKLTMPLYSKLDLEIKEIRYQYQASLRSWQSAIPEDLTNILLSEDLRTVQIRLDNYLAVALRVLDNIEKIRSGQKLTTNAINEITSNIEDLEDKSIKQSLQERWQAFLSNRLLNSDQSILNQQVNPKLVAMEALARRTANSIGY